MCAPTPPTTGQRKNKQTETTRASWKQWIERVSQNLTTLLDLCNNVSRGICIKERLSQRRGNTASQRRDTKHGLAEAKHQTRPRRGETPSNTTRERMAQKLRETLIQNITRLLKRFPRIRELMESSQPEDKTLLRVSRLHRGTL